MFHHFSSTLSHSHFINGLARTRAVVLVPGLTAAMDDENNVDTPADSIVLEEEIDPDYVPTQKEVEEYATCESAARTPRKAGRPPAVQCD